MELLISAARSRETIRNGEILDQHRSVDSVNSKGPAPLLCNAKKANDGQRLQAREEDID